MYHFSDSDSVDSDKGIRYKTDSIRNKDRSSEKDSSKYSSSSSGSRREKNRSRSRSPRHHDKKRRKSKKRKRGHSSEDEDRDRSRHRDRRRDDRRHREHDLSDRRNKIESLGKDVKRSEVKKDISEISSNANEVGDQKPTLGPALPPHLLHKSDIHSHDSVSEMTALSLGSKSKEEADSPPNPSQSVEVNYGPSLPPKFKQKSDDSITTESDSHSASICNIIGPVLPEDLEKNTDDICGPTIPKDPEDLAGPTVLSELKPPKKILDDVESNIIGPVLPSEFIQEPTDPQESSIDLAASPDLTPPHVAIGPILPPDLRKKLLEENSFTGECLEEEVYGPVPEGELTSRAHIELEERALRIKMDQLQPEGDKQQGREEWMLTLPEVKAAKFGLGPRSFRAKAGPDLSDRSSWTDTPEDKAKKKGGKLEPKLDVQKEAHLREARKRDDEQEVIAQKSKKHTESLLESHQKKMKKEKSDSGPSERRPFSREIDLQVNRFDEAQKKAVLKKAQLLDTRFSTGESKYL